MENKLLESISNLLKFCECVTNDNDIEDIIIDNREKQELLKKIQMAVLSAELTKMKDIIAKVEDTNRSDKLW